MRIGFWAIWDRLAQYPEDHKSRTGNAIDMNFSLKSALMILKLSTKFQLNRPIKTRDNWETSFGSYILGPFSKNGYNSGTENAMDKKSSLK